MPILWYSQSKKNENNKGVPWIFKLLSFPVYHHITLCKTDKTKNRLLFNHNLKQLSKVIFIPDSLIGKYNKVMSFTQT